MKKDFKYVLGLNNWFLNLLLSHMVESNDKTLEKYAFKASFEEVLLKIKDKNRLLSLFPKLITLIGDPFLKIGLTEYLYLNKNEFDIKPEQIALDYKNLALAAKRKKDLVSAEFFFQKLKSLQTEKNEDKDLFILNNNLTTEAPLELSDAKKTKRDTPFFIFLLNCLIPKKFFLIFVGKFSKMILSCEAFWMEKLKIKENQSAFLKRFLLLNKKDLDPYSGYTISKAWKSLTPNHDGPLAKYYEDCLIGVIDKCYKSLDCLALDFYLPELRVINPLFCQYFLYAVPGKLGSPVNSELWSGLEAVIPADQKTLRRNVIVQKIIFKINEGDLKGGINYFIEMNEQFDILPRNIKLVIGILRLGVKQKNFEQVNFFKTYVVEKIKNGNLEKFAEIKLFEINQELEKFFNPKEAAGESSDYCDELFQKIESLKTIPENTIFFEEVKEEFRKIKKTNKTLLNIRTSKAEQDGLYAFIKCKILNKNPFILVRLGDGESLGFDSLRFSPEQIKEDHEALQRTSWCRCLPDLVSTKIKRQFQETLFASDVIGIPSIFRFASDFSSSEKPILNSLTPRSNLIVLQETAKLIATQKLKSEVVLVEHRCHQVLFTKEKIDELARLAENVMVITKHSTEKMKEMFDLKNTDFIQVPPERDKGVSLPFVIDEIAEEVERKLKANSLVLVAAGYAGKYFLKMAKEKGGVGLDVGAMADYWVGVKSRQVSDLV